ncbi:MAG: glycerol-3-phosphate dehydrogenase [Oscillospiraceae bacterium]|nr:MAG: glycerol-3-phosphate dehydrogenase [Oscillospiraceae bacterium]
MAKLIIMGAGGMGTALAVALDKMGHQVWLWGWSAEENAAIRTARENVPLLKGVKIPESIEIVDDAAPAADCDFAIIATPTIGVRGAAKTLRKVYPAGRPVVCTSKGLEPGTLLPLHETVGQELPDHPFVALSGPSHAEELSRGIPTVLAAASTSRTAAEQVQELTAGTHIRIYTNDDLMGVELGGALKNVIAFASGIIDGMGYGDNTKAALMTRGLTEIARLGVRMGARTETFAGLAGVGDLIVTCCSQHSRNHRCGVFVGQGMTVPEAINRVGMTVEGVTAALCAHELAEKLGVEMPITEQIYRLIQGEVTAAQAAAALLGRPLRHESESNWLGDLH